MSAVHSTYRDNCVRWLLAIFLIVCSTGWARQSMGQAEERALVLQSMSLDDFMAKPLRLKVITTRALTLYWQDLLPQKAHPTAHLVEMFNETLLSDFKAAQVPTHPAMAENRLWPAEASDLKPVESYILLWTELIQLYVHELEPLIGKSPLVEPLSDLMDPSSLAKLRVSLELARSITKRAQDTLPSSPEAQMQMSKMRVEARTRSMAGLIKGMEPHLHLIKSPTTGQAIDQTLTALSQLQEQPERRKEILTSLKEQRQRPNSPWQKTRGAMLSVPLPESGEIDGSLSSFESVYRLTLGWQLLERLLELLIQDMA